MGAFYKKLFNQIKTLKTETFFSYEEVEDIIQNTERQAA
jgi:hypothetical protein